jgi:hypothetical protein
LAAKPRLEALGGDFPKSVGRRIGTVFAIDIKQHIDRRLI